MTAGLAATGLANGWLNVLRGTTFTGLAGLYVKLHTGDPGAAGTSNAAAGSTTRQQLTHSAASGGSMSLSSSPTAWSNGGTSETLTHVSFWDDPSAGTFRGSAALSSSQAWASGNSYQLTGNTWSLTPIAA